MIGRLIGIARRTAPRARMESVDSGEIVSGAGLVGDHKGGKFPSRGITVLAAEDWAAALADLTASADPRLVNTVSPDLFPAPLPP